MYPAGIIADFGTSEQRDEWLPRALRGEARAVIGISEPATGSDMSALSTRAELDGDEWRIDGEKLYLSGLDYSQIIFLAAITDPTAPPRKGVSVFMIDADTPGIEATRLKTLGAWQNRTYHAHLRDVRVPRDRLMGTLNEGWKVLNGHMERERAGLAARAVGAAQSVLDEAVAYAQTRTQFGQAIGKFQAISHKLASMQIEIHVARVATYELAHRIDLGQDCRTEAAVVKTFATEVYKRAADDGLQVCGGSGYLRDSAMQRHYRDARLLTIGGGTSEIQRNIIARALGL
jgi:alkylation response protein AidB-like acyl-CoA dehydrogenase